ncbi:MAG: prephenate dehydratase, partial [Acidobacteria bacterium]
MSSARKRLRVPAGTAVAFQGELGAFSQRAVYQIFGHNIRPTPCVTFDEAFEKVARRKVPLAVIAIENSLAGSIHQ